MPSPAWEQSASPHPSASTAAKAERTRAEARVAHHVYPSWSPRCELSAQPGEASVIRRSGTSGRSNGGRWPLPTAPLELAPVLRLVELTVGPEDSHPVVDGRGPHPAQGRRDDQEVGVRGPDGVDHRRELGGNEVDGVGRGAGHVEVEAGGEVLLIADQDVYVARYLPVDLAAAFQAAVLLPQTGPV